MKFTAFETRKARSNSLRTGRIDPLIGTGKRPGARAAMALALILPLLALASCGGSDSRDETVITVDSAADSANSRDGRITLREALAGIPSGGRITFAPALNGQTITLSMVGSNHSMLMGEVYAGMPPAYQGYEERDYGRSALYVRKSVTIDASALPGGITIAWGGGEGNRARVMAVYGDLTMRNVTVTGGWSSAQAIDSETQPYTLGRGGGLAVWGVATLDNCIVTGNTAEGDLTASRDRGTYGGGIYANGLALTGCVVSGNSAIGYGGAGGGIYSVGGADGSGRDVSLSGCTVSGNSVTAQHAYGGGIFSLGGGPDNTRYLRLANCTIARNLVEDHPGLAESGQYYYRGGGIYLGGGYLSMEACTVAENQVNGSAQTFSNKPNMGGGGIAATIGNAHVVESMKIWQSIVVGNTMNGAPSDLFTGSLLHFYSYGYNLAGSMDFTQILVPVPAWFDLSRRHWPKAGDQEGVSAAAVLDLAGAVHHPTAVSRGTDAGGLAVLWYPPAGAALDRVPSDAYSVTSVMATCDGYETLPNQFLNIVLEKIREVYGSTLGADFGSDMGDLSGVTWYLTPAAWPSDPLNAPWIAFWHDIDARIGSELGMEILGDEFWGTFASGPLADGLEMSLLTERHTVEPAAVDQLGAPRPAGALADIGAIEE